MVADNGVANSKYYGDVDARPMTVSDEGDVFKLRFVVSDTDGINQIKAGGVGAKDYEVRGVVSNKAGTKNGHTGLTGSAYSDGDVVNVRTRGNIQVEAEADSGIVDGDPIVVGAAGVAVKYVEPSAIGATNGSDVSAAIQAMIDARDTIVGVASSAPDANVVISMDLNIKG